MSVRSGSFSLGLQSKHPRIAIVQAKRGALRLPCCAAG